MMSQADLQLHADKFSLLTSVRECLGLHLSCWAESHHCTTAAGELGCSCNTTVCGQQMGSVKAGVQALALPLFLHEPHNHSAG